ncbi:Cys-tRNA(Pro) deacylase [Ectobacillus ponti]|uniref:Cys-tRNA(Pro)/Cys-tRNA(Cys) deacylase n=1 Tax=Ectobacillus ponti TaxID=2961894 RepID=A0AA41X8S4_9BACI|nr:Cys-tRNA(Pro) deacylase [Ectobacillus ponti]MCP8969213.1 Cys-tRNA(Pro) deacylase [Ectobacillus ponti]
MAQGKTNAMRLLDARKLPYEVMVYDSGDGKIDGISVAEKIGRNPEMVYKTLVTQGSNGLYVFVIPAAEELDLKKAAKAAGEKKIDMLAVKDLQKFTGYIRGGCSPVGMRKQYPTFLDESAAGLGRIVVSGGKIGVQMELRTADLQNATGAVLQSVIKA